MGITFNVIINKVQFCFLWGGGSFYLATCTDSQINVYDQFLLKPTYILESLTCLDLEFRIAP